MADKNFKVKHGLAMGDGIIRFDAETSTWQLSTDGVTFSQVASASTTLDGLSDVSVSAALAGDFLKWNGSAWVPALVALGTNTTGNYVSDVVSGTGVTVTHTPGEGSSASIAIGQDVATTASVTFAHVSAPVTGNVAGNASTATTLQTSRAISLAGDLSGSASFNGSSDVTITADIQPNSVALGTDTTGNYVSDVTAGTGVTVTHTPGEGSSPSIAIGQAVGTSSSVTFAHVSAPVTGNVIGNVAGDVTGNAGTATSLQTARAISLAGDLSGSASFNGTSDVTITATVQPNSISLGTDTTGNYMSGVTAGTGVSVTHTPGEGSSATIAIGQAVGTADNPSFAGVTADGVQIGISASAEIDTTAGNLVIDSAGGTVTIDDNLIVSGDLTVNGTTTTVNTETINLADNVIVLNSNETGSPSQNAGIEVERGTSANVSLRWNETSDKWEFTENGTLYYDIASEQYVNAQSVATLNDIDDVTIVSASAGDFLKWNGSAWVNDPINLGSDTVGNYVSDVSGGTGVTVTHTPGEGSSPSIAIGQAVGTSSSVTFAAVTAPLVGNASTATTLQNARTISLGGDLSGSASFNGSADVTITATVQPNSVALGTDTTGNYVANVVSGTGITVSHTPGEGSSASVALNASLDDLSNVTAPSPSDGQFLKYVSASTAWVPSDIPTINNLDDIGDVDVGGAEINYLLAKGESGWVGVAPSSIAANINLNDLGDVAVAPENVGEVLIWGDGSWNNEAATAFATRFNLDDIGNVSAESPSTGQFLQWNGTAWVPAAAGGAVTTTTISTNSETTVATFSKTAAESAEFIVKVKQGERRYSDKVLVLHNGTTADFTDFAELSLAATEPDVNSGATWTTRTSNFGNADILSVAFGNNLWVAGGYNGNIRTSTDAITWVTRTSNFGNTHIQSVAFGNSLWVAGGYRGQLRTSTDAITWVTRTSNFGTTHIRSVAFGNGLWVAGGHTGQIRTSTDAITWVTQTSNFGNTTIRSIAFGNNLWVAGGQSGQIRTSTDAITWVTRTSNFTNDFFGGIRSVAFGNNLWVAGGYYGQIRTSTDAITWVTRTSNFTNDISGRITSVAFGNSLWVAGGYSGNLRTSTDTITWVTRTSNFGSLTINSVAFGNNLLVAGGIIGEIRTSVSSANSVHVGGSTSSASVSFNADISGSDVRLRMTIPDAATTAATVKVLATTVGES